MKPETFRLNNDFQIVTHTMPTVESVVVQVWVKVGSRFEEEGKIGLSHFLEHMAFKGTNSRTAFDIAKTFDDIGGIFNAHTDRECTVYYAKVLKKDIKIAIEILADIIINSNLPDEEIEREKSVVIQEIYQTNDSPSNVIFDKYMEVAYDNQPFGRPILGSINTVQNFLREDILSFMNKYYNSNSMILTVAGNVTCEEVIKLASPYFSQICKHDNITPQAAKYTGGKYFEERELDQVNLMIGFPGVSFKDSRYYSIQVLDSILGGSMSSRLFQEIREKLGLVYSISSFNSSYRDTGIFSIYASTSTMNLLRLLKAIASEIRRMIENLTEEEVLRAKMKIESEVLMSREGTYSCAEFLGYSYSRYNRYVSKEELLQNFSSVSISSVRDCVEYLLAQYQNITVAAIGKLNSMPSYEEIVAMIRSSEH